MYIFARYGVIPLRLRVPQKLVLKPGNKLAFLHLHFTHVEVSGFTEWVSPPRCKTVLVIEKSLLKELEFHRKF